MNKIEETFDRARQPRVKVPDSIEVPIAALSHAPNGVPIHSLDFPDRDVVRFSFVFRAGTSWQEKPYVASVTVNTISEGSVNKTSVEIAELLDFYGSYFEVATDRDYAVITFCCLSRFFCETIEIAREILIYPVFPENELRTYCDKAKQRLLINRHKVGFVAREEFAKALFGQEHPYGHTFEPEQYDEVTGDDVRRHFNRLYRASNCFVVASGDIRGANLDLLKGLAGSLPNGEVIGRSVFPAPVSTEYAFRRFPDAVQSSIRTGRLLFPRSHPDFIGMQVVANILGGYFGSRLMRNLREERGYTYGVYAAMVNFDNAGYLGIGADVGESVTNNAVEQIFHEIEKLQTELITNQELIQVKKMIGGDVMRILDGPFGIADVTIESVQNGTDNHYVERMLDEVRGITPKRILELSEQYLKREDFITVIVGNEV